MANFFVEFLKLTRFEHAIMLAIAVFIGETIASGAIPALSTIILLSLLVPIFSALGAFALNDYLDVESDKINKRNDRPLVSGALSSQFAFYFSWISITVSVVLSYFINVYAFTIALVFNALAVAYNYKLKDLPVIGNIYIGLTMAIPFLFGSVVITNSFAFGVTILSIFAIAFIAGLAREIIKSIEDIEGDKKARKSNTLPIIIGKKNARMIAALLYIIFALLAFAPFYFGLKQTILAVTLVAVADFGILYIAYIVFSNWSRPILKKARNLSLLFLFIGLIGLLFGALG